MITVNLTMHQLAVLVRELTPEQVRAFSETNPAKPQAWGAVDQKSASQSLTPQERYVKALQGLAPGVCAR